MDGFRVPIIFQIFPDLFRQDRMVPMMKNHEAPGTIGDVGFHCPPVMMVMRQWNIPYGSF